MHDAPRTPPASVHQPSRRKHHALPLQRRSASGRRGSRRLLLTGLVVALGATSFVVASAANNEAEAAATDCWDEYTMSGTTPQRVITPKNVTVGNCTVPTVCLDGYSMNGSTPSRLYVPHGLAKSFCAPAPPPTTQPPPPPTTQPPPPPTTQPPPPPTTQPPPPPTTQPPPPPTTQPPPPPTTQPPIGGFLATFDTPADFYNRFDTYTGNYCTNGTSCRPENIPDSVKQFPGSHDMSCAAPPANRNVVVASHNNFFWHCAPGGASTGHVMTGQNASGYTLVSFTPKQSFTNVREVCWDVSLADLGGGKWANVVLVPEATYLSNPNTNPRRTTDGEGPYRLDYVTPGFDADGGPGDFNIQNLGSGSGAIVGVKNFRGTTMIYRGGNALHSDFDVFTSGTDQSTRFHHCFRDNRNGTVTYTQQRGSGTRTITTNGSFPSGTVRVLFQDDTYNADKHGGTGLYTWHWDNISIV